jgi:hypothetical protein
VFNAQHDDLGWVLANAVQDAIGPASGRPDAGQFATKWFADTPRFPDNVAVRNSITAAATGSGSCSEMARAAGCLAAGVTAEL